MIGRPTIMTTETLDKLREAFMMGYNDREACLYTDIGLQTLYDYQKENPDYSEQKELFKQNPVLKAKRTIYDEIEKGNLKVSMWYLERKKKDEFSLRTEIKNNEDVDVSTILDSLEKTDYAELGREAQMALEGKKIFGTL